MRREALLKLLPAYRRGRNRTNPYNPAKGSRSLQTLWYSIGTVGFGAVAGGGLAMLHGLDGISTGIRQMRTNQFCDSGTSQLLQNCGVPPQYANLMDAGIGIAAGRYSSGSTALLGGLFGKSSTQVPKFLKFTEDNFRENLKRFTGTNPGKLHEAHHTIPKAFEKILSMDYGINVHDPKYGIWIEKSLHNHLHKNEFYNQVWWGHIRGNPSHDEILQFGRDIMKKYGFQTNF